MRVLVTGGNGFIGSPVCDTLRAFDHEPVSFDRKAGHDIVDRAGVWNAVEDVDAVIHLAGVLGTHELFDSVRTAIDVNIGGSLNVIQACADQGKPLVNITMPAVFPSIYTATKLSVRQFLKAYAHDAGLRFAEVCAYNAFGPGQAHGHGHPQKIVPTFAVNGWAGTPIPVWGDGLQGVDLIHVDQVADVLVNALELVDGDIYDAGSGQMFTVRWVAELVRRHTGKRSDIEYLPMRRGEVPTQIMAKGAGWSKLRKRPSFNIDDLLDTIDAYRPIEQAAA